MIGSNSTAAASATVGVDLFKDERWNISSKPRIIRGISCVGSAAINDFYGELYIESTYIGRFYNTHAGVAAPLDSDFIPLGKRYVPAGAKISFIVGDAATTNPVVTYIW